MRKSARALRKGFLDYFAKHGHTVVKSSPLVPLGDPTLMFVNAGMVPFKDIFVGLEQRPYTRAASAQKCMRVSGKHNDLEEVGRTARHQTFFEMLGNFSFGDYFKEEAIVLAWEFVVKELGLDGKRIWATVFGGADGIPADDQAKELWRKVGLPPERIVACGMKDNFWAMGDTGPCGPCSELHFDLGAGPVGAEDFESGRILEFWNNVFMQFERRPDGSLQPLPKPCVDTGLGLERLASLVQGETSNYHTDLFMPLMETIAKVAGKGYRRSDSEDDVSMRVIADHARATAFLTADGVQPSNEGRGYVMRRIMRRAIRHGRRLGLVDLFLAPVCQRVVELMGEAYPELRESHQLIGKVAQLEEKNFRRTLDTGLGLLDQEIGAAKAASATELSGEAVFKLYDTYGFPKDLTEVIALEHGFAVDDAGFEREMLAQRQRSRAGDGAGIGDAEVAEIYKRVSQRLGQVRFVGYGHEDEALEGRAGAWRSRESSGTHTLEVETQVRALIADGAEVQEASAGVVEVVLDPTPFYGESGGQVGDRGVILADGLEMEVSDCTKPTEGLIVARGTILKGSLKRGQSLWAGYFPEERKDIRAHHSATHLLHGALRKVLGSHVKQAGSRVSADRLRFDYAHFEAPTHEQLAAAEQDANQSIEGDHTVETDVLPFEQAKQRGALAFFGDKYGDTVRMVSMGPSIELCGGTHARRTSDLGLLIITKEEAIQSGVRRIEAEVGRAAQHSAVKTAKRLCRVADLIAGRADKAGERDDTEATHRAVAKARRQFVTLVGAVRQAGATPVQPAYGQLSGPELGPGPMPLAVAQRLRDQWQGLVLLANSRGTEAAAIADQYQDCDEEGLLRAFAAVLEANRDNERLLDRSKSAQITAQSGDLVERAKTVGSVRLLATRVEGVDSKSLRELADKLRDKLGSGVLCLGADNQGKAALLVAVTKDLTPGLHAGQLIKELAPLVGGRGGGKPELAQAGGSQPEALDKAFARLEQLLSERA